MNMDFIQVDQDKCTRCGICATVCPGLGQKSAAGYLAIVSNKKSSRDKYHK